VTVSLDADADDETLDGIVTRVSAPATSSGRWGKMLTCP